ncbi:hypothetical protein BT63DRAFT_90362 [Microthyrium microscopicum]|uniref:Uncharacterized protein n=1 Tax=Microthyrium microscopicum TaxID=703497 RepID=A0A6A6TZP2_9PEZI|nr:hypothetical protein BT63DRAFT_90362 [Microthyrium microscopicum]
MNTSYDAPSISLSQDDMSLYYQLNGFVTNQQTDAFLHQQTTSVVLDSQQLPASNVQNTVPMQIHQTHASHNQGLQAQQPQVVAQPQKFQQQQSVTEGANLDPEPYDAQLLASLGPDQYIRPIAVQGRISTTGPQVSGKYNNWELRQVCNTINGFMAQYRLTSIEMYRILSTLPQHQRKLRDLDPSLTMTSEGDKDVWAVLLHLIQEAIPSRCKTTNVRRKIQSKVQRFFMGPRLPLDGQMIQWIRNNCADAVRAHDLIGVRIGILSHPTLSEQQKLAVHSDDMHRKLYGEQAKLIAGSSGIWQDQESFMLLQVVKEQVDAKKAVDPTFVVEEVDWDAVDTIFSHRSPKSCFRRFNKLSEDFFAWGCTFANGLPTIAPPWSDEIIDILSDLLDLPIPQQRWMTQAQQPLFQVAPVTTCNAPVAQQPQFMDVDDDNSWLDEVAQLPLVAPIVVGNATEEKLTEIHGHVADTLGIVPSENNTAHEATAPGPSAQAESSSVNKVNLDLGNLDFETDNDSEAQWAEIIVPNMLPGDFYVLLQEVNQYAARVEFNDFRLVYYAEAWDSMDRSLRSGMWTNHTRLLALRTVLDEHSLRWSDNPLAFQPAMARLLEEYVQEFRNNIDEATGRSLLYSHSVPSL